ncbi:hypothetical protein DAETH_43900 (plasmid) [Deinococcus aetherius]|uniref:Uncharacterized protein n=1 Tax=Deinococcus aetherius TaxID=200252 RepID=A0ABM8AKR1_9DEIO|nr:hypothetical protein [Deinococcus aetherius]BDP44421.1 hypothetical protein DAETH_43900 [Deinococcus aetherius]
MTPRGEASAPPPGHTWRVILTPGTKTTTFHFDGHPYLALVLSDLVLISPRSRLDHDARRITLRGLATGHPYPLNLTGESLCGYLLQDAPEVPQDRPVYVSYQPLQLRDAAQVREYVRELTPILG